MNARLSEHLRSPMLFRHMPAAAERVIAGVNSGERIGIYGDYDVDGISGSAILVRFLRALGHEPILYIPHRLRDGYGVSEAGVRSLGGRRRPGDDHRRLRRREPSRDRARSAPSASTRSCAIIIRFRARRCPPTPS